MGRHRHVVIENLQIPHLNEHAVKKLVRHYYKGKEDVLIKSDKRISSWGQYIFDDDKQVHIITFNPTMITSHQINRQKYNAQDREDLNQVIKLNRFDTICKFILVLLHEIKHVMQRVDDPTYYEEEMPWKHPRITNSYLGYYLSSRETEAEGYALRNFEKALEKYEKWDK